MMKVLSEQVLEAAPTMVQVFIYTKVLDSFRRFVKKIGSISNPEYDIDISKGLPYIADYGNI